MLVLQRRCFERVRIFGEFGSVWIRVNRINGNTVSLGFDAPADILIDREEVAEKRDRERTIESEHVP